MIPLLVVVCALVSPNVIFAQNGEACNQCSKEVKDLRAQLNETYQRHSREIHSLRLENKHQNVEMERLKFELNSLTNITQAVVRELFVNITGVSGAVQNLKSAVNKDSQRITTLESKTDSTVQDVRQMQKQIAG